jgi:hypothetical protein
MFSKESWEIAGSYKQQQQAEKKKSSCGAIFQDVLKGFTILMVTNNEIWAKWIFLKTMLLVTRHQLIRTASAC